MSKFKLLLSLALIFYLSVGYTAAIQQYQLELILFKRNNPQTTIKPLLEPLTTTQQASLTTPPNISPQQPQFQLNAVASTLQHNSNYSVLLHTAWILNNNDLTRTLRLQFPQKNPNSVAGQLTVHLDRYFSLQFNLWLAPVNASTTANPPLYYHWQVNRRTRSGIINYIDNPWYGMLLKLTPVDAHPNV